MWPGILLLHLSASILLLNRMPNHSKTAHGHGELPKTGTDETLCLIYPLQNGHEQWEDETKGLVSLCLHLKSACSCSAHIPGMDKHSLISRKCLHLPHTHLCHAPLMDNIIRLGSFWLHLYTATLAVILPNNIVYNPSISLFKKGKTGLTSFPFTFYSGNQVTYYLLMTQLCIWSHNLRGFIIQNSAVCRWFPLISICSNFIWL